jgi:RNA recognition motif-containing protein
MRIFVASLPRDVTERDLSDCFEQYGQISRTLLCRDARGKSRGFGFVDMQDGAAMMAIEELNSADWDGRSIHVAPARPRGSVLARCHTEGVTKSTNETKTTVC